ncbi:putative FUN34-transmembrane protein [Ceraceosorus guamensis]|uniref:Putative FUN34-transmembrane protein n=1 Tax=Ceraceosorus guamensis TaxID=1522189 RepID=A0A316W495_9BASI|nr:putative FUN34-transmembrane protein [Ceraceosorus guamensis]PWN44670.1 putative FUN34-transmembrane protein [Ceraceosorus guamensis]
MSNEHATQDAEKVYSGGAPTQRAVTPGGHNIDTTQPAFPVFHRKFANPAPLGLFGFAATTWTLSFYNAGVRGVSVPNAVIGLAVAYGGLAQFVAGVWEFASGNTFGATAFCSYGAFWWSYAALFIPFFGVQEAFMAENAFDSQFTSAVGIYLTSWGIFTFIMLLASFRASIGLASLFLFLDITFWLLVGAEFSGNSMVEVAAGAFGIITAAIAFYVGAAGLLTPETSLFTLPVGDLSRKD